MRLGPATTRKRRRRKVRSRRNSRVPKYTQGVSLSPSGFVRLSENGRSGVITRQVPGLCTWCGRKVPTNRKTWCSRGCVSRYRMTQPDILRELVERRDGLVCGICECDTYALRESMLSYEESNSSGATAAYLTGIGKPSTADTVRHLLCDRRTVWDMDHIVPVSKGGDPFSMENLRTLCYWCHKRVTKEMRGDEV